MDGGTGPRKVIVGVDGSDASVEAIRQGQRLATALGTDLEPWACWDLPDEYEEYHSRDAIDDFIRRTERDLHDSMSKVFGEELPPNVEPRLVRGNPRNELIEGSRNALMLVVGRSGRGRFGGLPIGSVSSACVAHAHCPVLVVHPPASKEEAGGRLGTSA